MVAARSSISTWIRMVTRIKRLAVPFARYRQIPITLQPERITNGTAATMRSSSTRLIPSSGRFGLTAYARFTNGMAIAMELLNIASTQRYVFPTGWAVARLQPEPQGQAIVVCHSPVRAMWTARVTVPLASAWGAAPRWAADEDAPWQRTRSLLSLSTFDSAQDGPQHRVGPRRMGRTK